MFRNNLPELNIAVGAGLQTSNINTGSPYCDVSSGFLTQFRGLGSYVIPKIDAQVERDLPEQARAGDRRQLGGPERPSSRSHWDDRSRAARRTSPSI